MFAHILKEDPKLVPLEAFLRVSAQPQRGKSSLCSAPKAG